MKIKCMFGKHEKLSVNSQFEPHDCGLIWEEKGEMTRKMYICRHCGKTFIETTKKEKKHTAIKCFFGIHDPILPTRWKPLSSIIYNFTMGRNDNAEIFLHTFQCRHCGKIYAIPLTESEFFNLGRGQNDASN